MHSFKPKYSFVIPQELCFSKTAANLQLAMSKTKLSLSQMSITKAVLFEMSKLQLSSSDNGLSHFDKVSIDSILFA